MQGEAGLKKVMLVFGTRPEAIKMCPLVNELKSRPDEFQTVVTVTGQHREMLDQTAAAFDLRIDYDLNLMRDRQTLDGLTARILTSATPVLELAAPDAVLVHATPPLLSRWRSRRSTDRSPWGTWRRACDRETGTPPFPRR